MSALANTPQAWSDRAQFPALDAVGWSAEGQQARFGAIRQALDPQPGEMLLDYGCGTGALAEQLDENIEYIGYDWAPGMVARASAEHPTRLFTTSPPRRADLIACVGTFNLPGNWSKQHTWHTIRHLWDTTGCRALAVSLYAGTDERCLIYDEAEALRCARDLAHDSRVTRWRHNDILLEAHR